MRCGRLNWAEAILMDKVCKKIDRMAEKLYFEVKREKYLMGELQFIKNYRDSERHRESFLQLANSVFWFEI